MSAPGQGGRPHARREPASVQFSEEEKIRAQWEARHDVAAAGRRPSAAGVAQYLAHTRCVDACSAPEHRHAERAHPARRAAPPPDPRPHVEDLLAWMVPPAPTRRDQRHT
jgi:hypothetical protein